jgi:superfamily II DNA or RNA helicase
MSEEKTFEADLQLVADRSEDEAPTELELMEIKAGFTLFDYQREFLDAVVQQPNQRALLFYKTGAGKSLTALLGIVALGHTQCIVIAPPSTHVQWEELGQRLGVTVIPMSHARFRMKDTKLSRHTAVIADEFHLFGGQKGMGWKKLDRLAMHLQAPLFLLSATPNYNDAERCYCIQHVLDPLSCRGGFLQFIYQHCETEQNPFGMEPIVTGFLHHKDAASYLASLPDVYYLPDDLVYKIIDIPYREDLPFELWQFGYDRRRHRMVASDMEARHTSRLQGLVTEDGYIRPTVMAEVRKLAGKGPMLVYANHATVADAMALTCDRDKQGYRLVTGSTTKVLKDRILREFKQGQVSLLIGTASLATGTDGLDRVCDTLVILDDTDDDALRRQLIGRIMPRGDYVSVADKQVFRFVPS